MFTGTILSYARDAVHRYERFSGVSYGAKPLMTQGYSLAEEIANSISHGIGLVFGIVGWCCCWFRNGREANAGMTAIASYSLYGGSMILLFLPPTLYHAIPHQRAKSG